LASYPLEVPGLIPGPEIGTVTTSRWRFSLFVLAPAIIGCHKGDAVDVPRRGGSAGSVATPTVKPAQASAVAPSKPAPQTTTVEAATIRFSGEVTRGQQFEKRTGSRLIFRLEPDAGDDSGWSIRLAPESEPSPASIDCIGSVSQPLYGSNKLSIEPSGGSLINGHVIWFSDSREFYFTRNPADCKAAWDLANAANYPSKLTDEQREEASEKLFRIPTGHGVLRILDSKVKAGAGQQTLQAIEWMKFDVELNFSAPENGNNKSGERAIRSPKDIHEVDVEKFLKTRYTEVQPDLEHLEEECGVQGLPHIHDLEIQYGDLDGDGQDEAVYEGLTCMSGTAGIDFAGVLKMKPGGKIVPLPIEGERKEFKGRGNLYEDLRGHMRLQIKNGRLLEVFPVYTKEDGCNACSSGGTREFVYRWDGHQFVLDDIIDVPPEKSGN
jgi:hypothetical protein